METISRLPRRLTQLYTDTKVSCDAVTEQDTTDTVPEVNALHRKYRIQKNRLIAWGLEWSDNTKGKPGDIDESVERAGLTETVTSVLGTIKDILDEAERMQHAGLPAPRRTLDEKSGRTTDQAAWAASDRSRYEDLAKDLTTSIDILYDLSRARSSHQDTVQSTKPLEKSVSAPSKGSASSVFLSSDYSASDLTLVHPATLPPYHPPPAEPVDRPDLPQKLDPSDLILPLEEPPPYESVGVSSAIRVIGHLKSTHSSTNPWKTDGSKTIETPVLVEYATFDSTYRSTEVSPPLDRLEALLSILARLSNEQSFHGTLPCVGYFEDPKQPRFGLVFKLPSSVYSGPSDLQKPPEELRPVTLLSVLQTGSKSLHNSNSATPPLEDRFRLAFTLARTFSKIHGEHFTHKDVNSSNILVFRKNRPLRQSNNSRALQFHLRSPVICSFDLFSEYAIEPPHAMASPNIYRHPEDPQFTGEKAKDYGPQFDLYGLGLVLLEIGLWQPLSDFWKPKYSLAEFKRRIEEVYIRRLASKCGTAYMTVVRDCFWAAERLASGAEQDMSQLYNRILIRLQRCCLLDESESSMDWGGPGASMASASLGGSSSLSSGSMPLKRKAAHAAHAAHMHPPATSPQPADVPPPSPSAYRSAKRWALEKAPQILDRKPLSKLTSSNNSSSLSRSGSKSSQHSIRKSISHTFHNITSPKETPSTPMDWQPTAQELDPLAESGTLVDSSKAASPVLGGDEEGGSTSSVAQFSIKPRHAPSPPRPMSVRDFTEKITLIQKYWRQRKQRRANAMESHAISALVNSSTRDWPQAALGYPTPEPEARPPAGPPSNYITSSIQIQTEVESTPRPRLKLHPAKFQPDIVEEWHNTMLPRLERLMERALKDSEETVSIDLVAVGETQASARPTIFVTCASTLSVKALLARRFRYDDTVYDLKVRRGKVRRSKLNRSPRRRRNPPHRSMMNTDICSGDMQVNNPFHQEKPLCGASIGAFRGQHLPPVSYGGVILVDDKPLGMSVHHLLDAPSEDEDSDDGDDERDSNDAIPSSANSSNNHWLAAMGSNPGVQIASNSPAPAWELEISDDEDLKPDEDVDDGSLQLLSESDEDDEFDSEDEYSDEENGSLSSQTTAGDIDGIDVDEGDEIQITQPALDDVDDDFFPSLEDRDEDHLDSHLLGTVHASSGIRRWKRNNIVHEIDWALLKIKPERLQPYNLVQGGRKYCRATGVELDQEVIRSKLTDPVCRRGDYRPEEDEYPCQVASADSLGGMYVHCFGRTSGLQPGVVGSAMSSVRIYRRKTFSRSWHVIGNFGVGGDSGAWVIQNTTHHVAGHVLAWCSRNNIAYICPMEILLQDIKRALGAKRVYLPGSAEEAQWLARRRAEEHIDAIGERRGRARDLEELEGGVRGLGIVDSAIDMSSAAEAAGVTATASPHPSDPPPSYSASSNPSISSPMPGSGSRPRTKPMISTSSKRSAASSKTHPSPKYSPSSTTSNSPTTTLDIQSALLSGAARAIENKASAAKEKENVPLVRQGMGRGRGNVVRVKEMEVECELGRGVA